MAAAKRNRKKRRKGSSILSLFGACFGVSKRVSADGEASNKSCCQSSKTIAIDDHKLVSIAPAVVSRSGKGIVHRVVEAEDEKGISQIIVSQPANGQVIIDERNDDKIVPAADEQITSLVEPGRAIRHASSLSLPSSLNTQLESRRNSIKQLSRPVSLPMVLLAQSSSNVKGGSPAPPIEPSPSRGFDPILGALFLTVTLVVMLICGKICALICTVAWFYFIPRFMMKNSTNRKPHNHHLIKPAKNDIDSWEYKQMVVLRGLLHRDHRPHRFQ